jgi:regulator of protease activity HflC (stomatin/prohibitin superfamily)
MKAIKKLVLMSAMMVLVVFGLTGCRRPYDKPEFVTIEASQTAFLIPLVGNTSEQASFESEELLDQAKVATKEIQIPHRWVQTGRKSWSGEWRASAKLIVVERKPVTREWIAEKTVSVGNGNMAVYAESRDAVGFYVGMNCSAQIDENNATKFLYRYNNKPLEEIMDSDIRALVESEFNKECSKYDISEINSNKAKIMDNVVNVVTKFFKERGITITVLGMKEGITFESQKIQDAIDEKFESEQMLVIQNNLNEANLAKAQAEAEAKIISAEAEAEANKKIAESLTPELLELRKMETYIEKWNGQLSTIQGESNTFMDVTGLLGK